MTNDRNQPGSVEERAHRWGKLIARTDLTRSAYRPVLVLPEDDLELTLHNLREAFAVPGVTLVLARHTGTYIILEAHPAMARTEIDAHEASGTVGVLRAPTRAWRSPTEPTSAHGPRDETGNGPFRDLDLFDLFPHHHTARLQSGSFSAVEDAYAFADAIAVSRHELKALLGLGAYPQSQVQGESRFRLFRAAELADHARHVLNGDSAAGKWLTSQQVALRRSTPLEACRSAEGAQRAHLLLNQLSQGTFE